MSTAEGRGGRKVASEQLSTSRRRRGKKRPLFLFPRCAQKTGEEAEEEKWQGRKLLHNA